MTQILSRCIYMLKIKFLPTGWFKWYSVCRRNRHTCTHADIQKHYLSVKQMISTFQLIFIAHKRSLGQSNIFSSVCQEFCSQGGLPQCMLGYHPLRGADTPLGADTPPPPRANPPEQTPPVQCMLGDTVNKRAVCILLECNLVIKAIW